MSESASVCSSGTRARHQQELQDACRQMHALYADRLAQQAAVLRQEAQLAMARQLEQEAAQRMDIMRLRAQVSQRSSRSGRSTPSHTKAVWSIGPEVTPVETVTMTMERPPSAEMAYEHVPVEGAFPKAVASPLSTLMPGIAEDPLALTHFGAGPGSTVVAADGEYDHEDVPTMADLNEYAAPAPPMSLGATGSDNPAGSQIGWSLLADGIGGLAAAAAAAAAESPPPHPWATPFSPAAAYVGLPDAHGPPVALRPPPGWVRAPVPISPGRPPATPGNAGYPIASPPRGPRSSEVSGHGT